MILTFDTFNENQDGIITGPTIDLGAVVSLDAWSAMAVILLLIERCEETGSSLVLPRKPEALCYLKSLGLNDEDSKRVATLVGELGNNVFDHNSLNWPADIVGCFVVGQSFPKEKKLQVIVADPGVGFLGSLKLAYPDLANSVEAIRKGLAGFTGRVGEPRGNGLKFVQEWAFRNFAGRLQIHSGDGLVVVDKDGFSEQGASKISGTIVQLMLYYK